MSWNKNNRAHTSLWFFEKWHHNESDASFSEVGDWEMKKIIKSVANDTVALRGQKSRTHAELLDGAFINLFRATYENNISQDDAVSKLTDILHDESKKLQDIGDLVDDLYQFFGEVQ